MGPLLSHFTVSSNGYGLVPGKRGNRTSEVLLHISGNPTYQASGSESANTTPFCAI
jgi:hypothetical protein